MQTCVHMTCEWFRCCELIPHLLQCPSGPSWSLNWSVGASSVPGTAPLVTKTNIRVSNLVISNISTHILGQTKVWTLPLNWKCWRKKYFNPLSNSWSNFLRQQWLQARTFHTSGSPKHSAGAFEYLSQQQCFSSHVFVGCQQSMNSSLEVIPQGLYGVKVWATPKVGFYLSESILWRI